MDESKIKSVRIYPAIGIARVGNSPDEHFFAQHIPGQSPTDDTEFRDKDGLIKRQATRFFVFALDKDGNVLGELNETNGTKITWNVQIANKKAAWYNFELALDIPAAKGNFDSNGNPTQGGMPLLNQRRNRSYSGEDRQKLMILPSKKKIEGIEINKNGKSHAFDDGEINGKRVYLGEIRTDEKGRLVFLGGRGKSASFDDSPLSTFANNQGWYDDTSDGTVDAKVVIGGKEYTTKEGAWIVTAPPNYAVGIQSFITGYDLIYNVALNKFPKLKKNAITFYDDIYPILKHLSDNQWVNAGIARMMGWGSANNFYDAAWLELLSDNSDDHRHFRHAIMLLFRNPDYKKMQPQGWPPLYGDAASGNTKSTDPRNWHTITPLQFSNLKLWADGIFERGELPSRIKWEDLTATQQADGLTEAALEEALGGPFHPGCEFSWPMRNNTIYSDEVPFRIKRRKKPLDDVGIAIDSEIAFAADGPLDGSSPGDITKWMAVPWQTDTASCLAAYDSYIGEYLPTFWPSRVPNDVLTEAKFDVLTSSTSSVTEKLEAFSHSSRKKWLRGFVYNDEGKIIGASNISDRLKAVRKFTNEWHKAGIVTERELPGDSTMFPKRLWVETGRQLHEDTQLQPSGKPEPHSDSPKWIRTNPRKLR